MMKKEIRYTIKQTTEKVKCNEVDFQVANEIIDSLTATIKHMDTLMATSARLEKKGTREEVIIFAEHVSVVVISAMRILKSLCDLYDISTYSQFETATFFSADSSNIPPEKIAEARKAIEPVAQRIVRFLGDHPRQRFVAVITCSSTLVDQELNFKLCQGRARSVTNLLVELIRSNEEFIPKPNWIHYNIKCGAISEEFPYCGRKKHHTPEDNHRSMVSLNWNLLPTSLHAGTFN
ncbi:MULTISPECIES: hypothetical protein [Niastella]|uniref:OmpA-like domain-containing protein n=1 Tax=Niastella soli TaxID=2821487 RepID=A0ABS3YNI0_9BACT|nr:hypothetical protein [Niastella soli]MBO9199404.1 hypothetical protein [Niastella soli]